MNVVDINIENSLGMFFFGAMIFYAFLDSI